MNQPTDPKQDQASAAGGSHQQGAYPLDRYSAASKSQEGGSGGDKSPYFKSSAPVISLPKGGGALKGIDEKFTVNAVNGTASMQIPFPFTPGRGGFTPSLSADYNSGTGNSEFGLGWNLSLPVIQRRTNKKLPLYDDSNESDVFVLAGAEDLVPKLDLVDGRWVPDEDNGIVVGDATYNIKRYRPRIEGLWAKIEHIQQLGATWSWWKVTTKDNIVTFYGLTGSGTISDPNDGSRIFKWLPEVSYDNKGNVMQYSYIDEDITNVVLTPHENNRLNGNAPIANTYLQNVAYCNKTPFIITPDQEYDVSSSLFDPDSDFLMRLEMDFGDHDPDVPTPGSNGNWPVRLDPFSDFHAGFEIRCYRLCRRVLMFHYFDELLDINSGNPVLVRSVDLTYFGDTATVPLLEADYIRSFNQKGYILNADTGEYFSSSLPPVTLTYAAPPAYDPTIYNVSRQDAVNAPQGLTGPYQWLDFYGEGLPGILTEQAHGWYYKENLGGGHFTPALQIATKPSLQGLGQNLQWNDLEADGRRQLVSHDPASYGYFELNDDQQWQPFLRFKDKINVDWNSPFTKMLDLDGDGRPDLLLTEDRVWRWYENEGTDGFTIGGETSIDFDEEKKPRLLHNDLLQTIFLADLNGDGMTDIVRILNGSVCYWPNMGYGNFGAKVTMSNAPVFDRPDVFDPMYITLADINGTGAADLIYTRYNQCSIWTNLAGNGWSTTPAVITLPEINHEAKITVMDFLGSGTACIVWSSPLPQHAYAPLRYIDLLGGNKPYLLTSYSNGMGKTVELIYKQSTQFYLADKLTSHPWATHLPFPVHCVSQVKTSDDVSQTIYTQSYTYHHGYYDHAEREFRGFGRVETTDTDSAITYDPDSARNDLDQAPVYTKTWYHTGAWMREGSLLDAFATEYYATSPALPTTASFPSGLNPQEQREAYRALKGQPLRQEVYALDESDLQNLPYTVTSHCYAMKEVQPLENNLYASFFSYQQQALQFSCERIVDDPRISHQLTLAIDELGNVLESASVTYPRSGATTGIPEVDTVQAMMLATYSVNVFTNDVLTGGYHLRVPCEGRAYELTGLSLTTALWNPSDLLIAIHGDGISIPPATEIEYADTPGGSGVYMRQLSIQRTIFQSDDTLTILNLGLTDTLALPYNHYTLAFTNDILTHPDYYGNGSGGSIVTTAMLAEGGYLTDTAITGFPAPTFASQYWLPGGLVAYDTANFYTPTNFADPFGNLTTVAYWESTDGTAYYLLPASVTDALANITAVTYYNWYNLQPSLITDMNGNQVQTVFDNLGMPVAQGVMGKPGDHQGDDASAIDPNADTPDQELFFRTIDPSILQSTARTLLGNATWRCVYDFTVSPVAVAMIAREIHAADDLVDASPLLIRFSYTDGMGRMAMNKVQAAPAEGSTDIRWIGSGKAVYNNKGSVVMQYEPYFSTAAVPWGYDPAEAAAAVGVTPRMHYDPVGRVYRTDLPDGSYTKITWDGWMQTIYDNNDTVADSQWYLNNTTGGATPEQISTAAKALNHNNTPTVIHLDTLGRAFYTIQNEALPDPNPLLPWDNFFYASYVDLDIEGNRLAIHDARLPAITPIITYTYGMLKAVVQQVSRDSGTTKSYTDVGGQPAYMWDAAGNEFHLIYDELRRQRFKDVTYGLGPSTNRLEEIIYGETVSGAADNNLLGKVYQFYDGVGMKTVVNYDFKGNPTATNEQLLSDATIIDVNWNSPPALAAQVFTTSVAYDAFNRPVTSFDQGGNKTTHGYDQGGGLFSVSVLPSSPPGGASTTYISAIYHDAKGQRLAIYYGNGAKTTYAYDPDTFRVTNILTQKTTGGSIFQNLSYWYDPVGNITIVKDAAQRTLFFNNAVVLPEQSYTYSALYRLIQANGREKAVTATWGATDNYNDNPWMGNTMPGDDGTTQNYTQKYSYDAVGNLLTLQHFAMAGSYTRNYTIDSGSNKLLSTAIGSGPVYSYTYDAHGNMATMPNLTGMVWSLENQLGSVTTGLGTSTTTTSYQYSGGERARKITVKPGGITEQRIYFGDFEIYRKFVSGVLNLERTTVHVGDDAGRVAMLEMRTSGVPDGSPASLARYIYSNHLGTATLELDPNAMVISYEEYHPYGTTSYQGQNTSLTGIAKRYRYTGKERDDESGLYYHGARYYIPWLGRWSAVDALEADSSPSSPFGYCDSSPIVYFDETGMQKSTKKGKKTAKSTKNGNKKEGNDKGSTDGKQTYSTMGFIPEKKHKTASNPPPQPTPPSPKPPPPPPPKPAPHDSSDVQPSTHRPPETLGPILNFYIPRPRLPFLNIGPIGFGFNQGRGFGALDTLARVDMHTSDMGLQFIADHEGIQRTPYNDSKGYATIGIGHLLHKSRVTEQDRRQWGTLSDRQVMNLFRQDIARFEEAVNRNVNVPLTQAQFDATVSFTFNVGIGAFLKSAFRQQLNRRHYDGTLLGNYHRPIEIMRRRGDEIRLFSSGQYNNGNHRVVINPNFFR